MKDYELFNIQLGLALCCFVVQTIKENPAVACCYLAVAVLALVARCYFARKSP